MRKQLFFDIAYPPAFDVPVLTKTEAVTLSARPGYYVRVASASANLLEETSVEDAGDTPDAIATRFGCDTLMELQAFLADHPVLFWDAAGHFGPGVYYIGVCCCDSLTGLADYALSRHWAKPGDVVWFFSGEYVGSCNDGDVVCPDEIIGILPIADFVAFSIEERQAHDADIHWVGCKTALGFK